MRAFQSADADVQLQRKSADSTHGGVCRSRLLQRRVGARVMIQLTRLNGQLLVVNSDLIKFIEQSPDTVLTLVTGEKIIVRETLDELLKKVVAFRQSILRGLAPDLRYSSPSANPALLTGETERKP